MSTLVTDRPLELTKVQATPMPTTGAGVALYLRVSRDRAGAGLAVERQQEETMPLAPAGYVHPYVDNDITASGRRTRPAFEQLLRDIEAGTVRTLLAWHPDRIYRTGIDLARLIAACDSQRVEIRTAKHGDLDLGTPTGRLLARLLADVATYELEHAVERMESQKIELAKAGAYGGGPRLFGYTRGFRPDEETGSVIIDSEADALRTVVANVLAGASLRSQCTWLNGQGITGTRGGPWTNSNLRLLLLRPALAGLRVHRHGKPDEATYPAAWPGLITVDQHSQLVALLNAPERLKGKGHNARKHLLSGIAACGVCGGPMAAATEKGSRGGPRYPIYRCKRGFCVNRAQARVDDIALRLVGAWLAKQAPTGLLDDPETSAELTRLAHQQSELARKLARIERDYDDEYLTGAQYQEKREALLAEQAQVEQQRLAHQQPASVLDELRGQPDAHALLAKMPLSRQRAVIAAVGTPVVHGGHRHIDDFSLVTMRWA